MKCPLKNYEYCAGQSCAFADEAGDCLVRQALQCYVSAERTRVAEETERIRRKAQLAQTYLAMKKDETRNPTQFLQDGDTTPYTPPTNFESDPDYPKSDMSYVDAGGITWIHQPSTEKYPHGGWFEDFSNMKREPK
jgi:hypothetical protein